MENPEVRQVLLDLFAHAKLVDSGEIARGGVRDRSIHLYERIDALDALIALKHPELAKIAEDLRTQLGPWDLRFSRAVLYRLFPKWMTVNQLLVALAWIAETRSTEGNFRAICRLWLRAYLLHEYTGPVPARHFWLCHERGVYSCHLDTA